MRKTVSVFAAVVAAVAVLMLGAAPAAARTAPPAPAGHRCNETYDYSDGLKGALSNIPYAKAKWTANSCGDHLEVKVRYTTGCVDSPHSGSVSAVGLWSEADGTSGSVYCSAWIRFKCGTSACIWGNWQRLANTAARRSLQ